MSQISDLYHKIAGGDRITPEEAVELFSWNLIDLGKAGNTRRQAVFPEEEVGFIIDRIVNFTNVCEAACRFCAFHARANSVPPYELTADDISQKVDALKAAGAREVHMRVSCPPIEHPCFYGIDFPTKTELIAARHSIEEIRDFIGATTLKYLDRDEMLACVSGKPQDYCTACFDGNYYTEIPAGQTKNILER